LGSVLYRPSLKLNMVWHHTTLLLLEAFRIKTPVLRNEQPAYTETVYLWQHHLDERILDNSNDLFRKLDSRQKSICGKGQSEGYFPVRPLCAIGCRMTHPPKSASVGASRKWRTKLCRLRRRPPQRCVTVMT